MHAYELRYKTIAAIICGMQTDQSNRRRTIDCPIHVQKLRAQQSTMVLNDLFGMSAAQRE